MVSRPTMILLAVIVTGCGTQLPPEEPIPEQPIKSGTLTDVFGNCETIEIVQAATASQSWRLDPTEDRLDGLHGPIYRPEWRVDDYPIEAGPNRVSPTSRDELISVVLDLSIYEFYAEIGCKPDFGYRVQFSNSAGHVDILFCFNCRIFKVYTNGEKVGGGYFPNDHDRILKAMKTIFSDDPLIQSLR